jgi:hypothetical protein
LLSQQSPFNFSLCGGQGGQELRGKIQEEIVHFQAAQFEFLFVPSVTAQILSN